MSMNRDDKMRDIMKVIFIPDYRNNNLYQSNLSNSLIKNNVNVYFGGSLLKSTIENWKPDIIHIHWPYPFMIANSRFKTFIKSTSFICALLSLRLSGVKIIWTVHNITDHEAKFKSLELLFGKLLTISCNKLIAHCNSAKVEIEKLYNKKDSSIVVIPHGNYIGYYENNISNQDARYRLNIGEDDIVFLYFGQIRSYKGIPELIDAFNMLNNKNKKIRLLIVGKPINGEIAAHIYNNSDGDRIKSILKFVPDEDIQIYMNAADIIVLPYRNVLTSGAALLAMSFGKSIIAPAVKCIVDTLDKKGNFLYNEDIKEYNNGNNNHINDNNDNDNNLFEAMNHALNTDRNTLREMGIYNLQLAEKFGWNEIGKKTYDIYCECISRG